MIESETPTIKEQSVNVGLSEAIAANQETWRGRNRFLSISSPVEVPDRFTKPVFDYVLNRFADYVDPVHKDTLPLVGFSILPEFPFGADYSYYLPNIGNYEYLHIFEEFFVEWLARDAYSFDPIDSNCYSPMVKNEIKKSSATTSGDLLNRILLGVKNGSVSRDNITQIFAKFILAGDSKPLDGLVDYVTNGEVKNFISCLEKNKSTENMETKLKFPLNKNLPKLATKSLVFAAVSVVQMSSYFSEDAHVAFPGVINVSTTPLPAVGLAHEFIHILSYHEKSHAGIPLIGYVKVGGLVY